MPQWNQIRKKSWVIGVARAAAVGSALYFWRRWRSMPTLPLGAATTGYPSASSTWLTIQAYFRLKTIRSSDPRNPGKTDKVYLFRNLKMRLSPRAGWVNQSQNSRRFEDALKSGNGRAGLSRRPRT